MKINCIEHISLGTALAIVENARHAGKHAYKSKCKICDRWIIKESRK